MVNFLKKYKFVLLFIVIGATGGYLYWYFIGCQSGTCAITSKWQNSALYGGLFGYLAGDFLNPAKRDKKQDKEEKTETS